MDIVNHSAGLVTSYHMLDTVVRGMFNLPMRLNSPTRTQTQLAVYQDLLDFDKTWRQ